MTLAALSLNLKPGALDGVAQTVFDVFSDLIPDVVSQGLQISDRSVDGTDKCVIGLQFDAGALDAKLRAALRAGGFELPERNDRFVGHAGSSGCVATPVDGESGMAVKAVPPERLA